MRTSQETHEFLNGLTGRDSAARDEGVAFLHKLYREFGVADARDVHAANETAYLNKLRAYLPPKAPTASPMVVGVMAMHPMAQLPKFMSDGAAGADLHACIGAGPGEFFTLRPTERMLVATGIALEIPAGYEGQIRPRSGLAKNSGITVLNAPGTIDSDYRGELHVMLINHGFSNVKISHGERIAQLVIAPVVQPRFVWTGGFVDTGRGDKGFGSTGV